MEKANASGPSAGVIHNPKLKLMELVREALRLRPCQHRIARIWKRFRLLVLFGCGTSGTGSSFCVPHSACGLPRRCPGMCPANALLAQLVAGLLVSAIGIVGCRPLGT